MRQSRVGAAFNADRIRANIAECVAITRIDLTEDFLARGRANRPVFQITARSRSRRPNIFPCHRRAVIFAFFNGELIFGCFNQAQVIDAGIGLG